MKTFRDCINKVKPEWAIGIENSIGPMPMYKRDGTHVPSRRQAQQIINLKKMMVIAEAVELPEVSLWLILGYECNFTEFRYDEFDDTTKSELEFIRICQDPDGDGDPEKDLFNPFKPEN